ncbi:MAG: metallophosphatase family protein [Clostridia bacterium]|nr:metallophosphatase family protein [Clostridia bacterium]
MRIALVADLHGNWPATLRLEEDLRNQGAARVICLGDVAGKGPSGDRTFDWAMANCDIVLGGNWDYGLGGKRFPMDIFYWEQLGEKRLKILQNLPREHLLTFGGRRVRLFHGRPVMESLITVRHKKEQILPFFEDGEGGRFDVVGYADTHRQTLRTMTPGLFFNCGSVGNALGEPMCCYALMEAKSTGDFELRFRSLEYDRRQAVADAQKARNIPRIDSYINEVETGVYSR